MDSDSGFTAMDWLENVTNYSVPLQIYSLNKQTDNSTKLPSNISHGHARPPLDDDSFSFNTSDKIIENVFVQTSFSLFYIAIFVIGLFGNMLVCYVVYRNKAMHTVTNFFITNLALSDILLCLLAVPFTPLYTFLRRWIFGKALCHLVPYAQGVSVYISTFTLTSIAMDRFVVIIFPFRHRMKLSTCILLITSIWTISLLLTLPYGLYVALKYDNDTNISYCEEDWPSENERKIFGTITASLQFAVPFLIIAICYILVSHKLNDRARSKPGSKTSKKEEADRDRKKRTNRMLISMVAVFGISWLPLNSVNIIEDYYDKKNEYNTILFFVAHCIAMSSTCYNPFLYAWLNENFRKEFKQVLPYFKQSSYSSGIYNSRAYRPDRTFCNGNNETGQESLLIVETASARPMDKIPRGPTCHDSIKKSVKVTIQNNEGFVVVSSAEDAKPQSSQQKRPQPTDDTHNRTKTLATGVLETPFDVVALNE